MIADRFSAGTTATQLLLTAAVIGGITMAPRDGAMLLVPLPGVPLARAVAIANGEGARLVAAGPLPRSVVIRGAARRLAGPMIAAGIIPLAAPTRWCGA